MSQEVNSVTPKPAFGEVDYQTVLFESLKEYLEIFFVSRYILACYQDMIDIHQDKIQTLTDSVHRALESLGSNS